MICVDEAKYQRPNGRKMYCHMIGSSLEELHEFANKIGLGRHLFHAPGATGIPHYDLTVEQRNRAIEAGAYVMDSRELVRIARGR